MHIIIPMSGVGKRFVDAGYIDPKPLIVIDGKPIIQHVIELFPGESKFTFICNETHLATTHMREVLESLLPRANIVSIPAHKKGPVFAVANIKHLIDDDEEVIVNYCDFSSYWNYPGFLKHTRNRRADGAVPAYRDFHPHMLGTTNYAFMRDDRQWMLEIQEKQPFTSNRMNEFASNGTYYFRKGAFVKKYFDQLIEKSIDLNGEYYVSLVFNLMLEDKLKISIYKVQHMLQWGTPQDVEEYNSWSEYFERVTHDQSAWQPQANSVTLIPLAGRGSRFVKEGYPTPKPLIGVGGKPMIVQANLQLPKSEGNVYVCLQEHIDQYKIDESLKSYQPKCQIYPLDHVTEGQAITCNLGLENVQDDSPLLIGACDNGMLWNSERYASLINDNSVDAVIWTFKNHPSAKLKPEMYGWVVTEGDKAVGLSVKKAISSTPEKDHAIVGAFYFKRTALFREALEQLVDQNIRVNNEFYVDSLMGVLVDNGYNVKVFEVDSYIGWGTPNDYQTFIYWQSFFHKCPWHSYTLGNDPTVAVDSVSELSRSFNAFSQEYE